MREIIIYSLPIFILAIIALGVYYVSRRLAWAFSLNVWVMFLASALVVGSSFVGMVAIMRGNYTSPMSHILGNASHIILGVSMLLLCVVLLMELVQLFLRLEPRTFGAVALGLTAAVAIYSLVNAHIIRVYHRDIEIPNLEQPMRIAHLTDIHLGHFWGENVMERVAYLVEREAPDLVVITGDMFDGRVRLNADVLKPLKRVTAPIYFVEGNHDGYSGAQDVKRLLVTNGVGVLSNELAVFRGLQIIGLNYLNADDNSVDSVHGAQSPHTIESVLPKLGIDRDRASILLHHNPVGVEYAAQNGVNLYLAGHTHAGQLFPATMIANMLFEYNRGLYRYNDTTQVYVSQGVGTFGPPMRLGTHSEITILNLK